MHTPVLIGLSSHSHPVQINGLAISESSLCFTGHPVIEFLFILLHPLVFLKLNDLLGDLVIGAGLFGDDLSRKEAVVMREREVDFQSFSSFLKLFCEYLLSQLYPLFFFFLFLHNQFGVDAGVGDESGRSGLFIHFLANYVFFLVDSICVLLSKLLIKLQQSFFAHLYPQPGLNMPPIFVVGPE